MIGGSPAGHEIVAFGDIWRVNYKGKTPKETHLIVCGINFVIKVSNGKVISECLKQLLSPFIGRMDTQSRRKYLGH